MKSRRRRGYSRMLRGEHFAVIPREVLESAAYRTLPDYAVRVLVALASEYRGANNGDLSLTVKAARELGVNSAWKVAAGLQLLREVGLIKVTREGKYKHGRGIAALYALEWKPIDPTDKAYPPIIAQLKAPNSWAKWEKPEEWTKREAAVRRKAKGSNSTWNPSTTVPRAGNTIGPHEWNEKIASGTSREESNGATLHTSRCGDPLDLGPGPTNTMYSHANASEEDSTEE